MSPPAPPSASGEGNAEQAEAAACRSSASGNRPCASSSWRRERPRPPRTLVPRRGKDGARPRDRDPLSDDTGRVPCRAWTTAPSGATPTRSCATALLIGAGDVLAVHREPTSASSSSRSPRPATAPARATSTCSRPTRASRARARSTRRGHAGRAARVARRAHARALLAGAGIVWITGSEDRGARRRASAARRAAGHRRPGPARYRRAVGRAERASAWWPGRRPPGPRRSTPTCGRGGGADARQRPAALRPPRRRRPAGRLAAARRAPGRARRAADARSTCASCGCAARAPISASACPRARLARRHQRRARPRITPNVPTEEVFTSPAPAATRAGSAARGRSHSRAGRSRASRRVPARPARADRGRGDEDREFLAPTSRATAAPGGSARSRSSTSLARRRGGPRRTSRRCWTRTRQPHRLRPGLRRHARAGRAAGQTAPGCTST